MPAFPTSEIVKTGATTAVARIQHGKAGLDWIVWQLTVQSIPARGGSQVMVTRNGLFITSSIVVPSSAQGPPAIVLHSTDVLEVSFSGLVAKDQALVTLLYEEVPWGEHGTSFGLV